jgi:hypothetical protein
LADRDGYAMTARSLNPTGFPQWDNLETDTHPAREASNR